MDALKLEIYIAALNVFKNLKEVGDDHFSFVCVGLKDALHSLGYESPIEDDYLEELFPEFFELYDGKSYYEDEGPVIHEPRYCHRPWWGIEYTEARINTLEFIIANRLG